MVNISVALIKKGYYDSVSVRPTIKGRKRLNCRTWFAQVPRTFFGEILKVSTWVIRSIFLDFLVLRRLINDWSLLRLLRLEFSKLLFESGVLSLKLSQNSVLRTTFAGRGSLLLCFCSFMNASCFYNSQPLLELSDNFSAQYMATLYLFTGRIQ